MQQIIDLVLEEIRGSWRFRRWALVTVWAVCIIGWMVVLNLPNSYQATARVFVDPRTALKPVLQGLSIEQDVEGELNLVRQSLLTEPQLRKIVDEAGIGGRIVTPQDAAAAVDSLRQRIQVDLERAEEGNPSKVYAISYTDSTRERSLQVVDILLNNFVEQTLGGKREGSENAQKFLEVQIKDYEQRLRAAEDRLAEFKKNNVGLMPAEGGGYFAQLQSEIDAAKKAESALSIALSRRAELQRQIRGESVIAAAGAGATVGATGVISGSDTAIRIKETQAKLDGLLLDFTDKHPDVIAARQTLVELQKRRTAEIESLKRGDANAVATSGAASSPVFQSIQLALNQVDVEIASLRGELAQHQGKAADLRRRLDTAPQVEAEYAELTRDYDVNKTQYTSLLVSYQKARLGEQADTAGSVRFEVIDPPNAPFTPSPNRLLLLSAVLGAALVAGAALAFLLNRLNPVFNDIRSLAEETGLAVIGAISLSRSATATQALRSSYLRYAGATGVLLALFVVVVIIGLFFSPLTSP